jgi:uncharacterized membrane protein (DUF373 family)
MKDRIISNIERFVITALETLIVIVVVGDTLLLFVLFFRNLHAEATGVEAITDLLPAVQRTFAGVLTALLGLELLETLRAYFVDHHIRLEVILVVAIIAIGRHVIQIDFEHASGSVLLGLSSVIIALTLGYFLVRKSQEGRRVEPARDTRPSAQ